jgi:hypothetical protein
VTAARATATRQRPEPAPAARAAPASAAESRDRLLRLQRLAGNQAVAAQFGGIPVAPPDGPYEAEAEAAGARAGRHGLSGALRSLLGRVRIHTDGRAQHAAQRLGAAAFTLDGEIYFNRGRFEPGTADGQALLAHELTHVAQQDRGAAPAPVQRCACGGDAGPGGECAACRARRLAAERTGSRPRVIQRQALGAPLGQQRFPSDIAPGVMEHVAAEKWSPTIEGHYRDRGDRERADAMRACRTAGGEACARILSVDEVDALMALAERAQGDEAQIRAGLPAILPVLGMVPIVTPGIPPLGPPPFLPPVGPPPFVPPVAPPFVPPVAPPPLTLPPVAVPPVGPVAPLATRLAVAGGVLALIAVCVAAGIELWKITKFQMELRRQGFIILDSPLAVCIGACHHAPPGTRARPSDLDPFAPRTPRTARPLELPPPAPLDVDIQIIEDWLRAEREREQREAARRQPQPDARPPLDPRTGDCTPERHRELQDAIDRACKERPSACREGMTKRQLRRNALRNERCARARERLNEECFRGGNEGHRNAARGYRAAAEWCWELYRRADRRRGR